MLIKKLSDIKNTEQEVFDTNNEWVSRRLLLKKDGMGFSMHDTVVKAGAELEMCYKNHLEACYCISGNGVVLDVKNNTEHAIYPGVLYALNDNDLHILKAETEIRTICVFNPPLTGSEVHDESGSYPASAS